MPPLIQATLPIGALRGPIFETPARSPDFRGKYRKTP